jgi:transposase
MPRSAKAEIRLTDGEETILRSWSRKSKGERRRVERAQIILMSHEGATVEQIAKHLNTRTARVSKWRQRFVARRLDALSDAPRSGKPARYDRKTEKRVLALLDSPPPTGYAQWNGRLVAEALGDVSDDQVWRIRIR